MNSKTKQLKINKMIIDNGLEAVGIYYILTNIVEKEPKFCVSLQKE